MFPLFRKRRFGLCSRRVGAGNLGGCRADRTKKTGQIYIFPEKADFIRPQGKTPTATLVVVEVV